MKSYSPKELKFSENTFINRSHLKPKYSYSFNKTYNKNKAY